MLLYEFRKTHQKQMLFFEARLEIDKHVEAWNKKSWFVRLFSTYNPNKLYGVLHELEKKDLYSIDDLYSIFSLARKEVDYKLFRWKRV